MNANELYPIVKPAIIVGICGQTGIVTSLIEHAIETLVNSISVILPGFLLAGWMAAWQTNQNNQIWKNQIKIRKGWIYRAWKNFYVAVSNFSRKWNFCWGRGQIKDHCRKYEDMASCFFKIYNNILCSFCFIEFIQQMSQQWFSCFTVGAMLTKHFKIWCGVWISQATQCKQFFYVWRCLSTYKGLCENRQFLYVSLYVYSSKSIIFTFGGVSVCIPGNSNASTCFRFNEDDSSFDIFSDVTFDWFFCFTSGLTFASGLFPKTWPIVSTPLAPSCRDTMGHLGLVL